jgi:hypothetical protein
MRLELSQGQQNAPSSGSTPGTSALPEAKALVTYFLTLVSCGTADFPILLVSAIDYHHYCGQPDIWQQELNEAGLPGRG